MEQIVGTCEGCGLGVTEGATCPDCGADVIWPDDDVVRILRKFGMPIGDVTDILMKLAGLHRNGHLTDDEYADAKRRVVDRFQ